MRHICWCPVWACVHFTFHVCSCVASEARLQSAYNAIVMLLGVPQLLFSNAKKNCANTMTYQLNVYHSDTFGSYFVSFGFAFIGWCPPDADIGYMSVERRIPSLFFRHLFFFYFMLLNLNKTKCHNSKTFGCRQSACTRICKLPKTKKTFSGDIYFQWNTKSYTWNQWVTFGNWRIISEKWM